MTSGPRVIVSVGPIESPARTRPPERGLYRVAAVQERWHADPDEHRGALADGIAAAAAEGAQLVCLQELTLSPYFAIEPGGPAAVGVEPEPLPGGPTHRFASEQAARHRIHVHASLYEAAADAPEDAPSGASSNETAYVRAERSEARETAGSTDPSAPTTPLGYNTAICVAPDGTLVARTRKLHIPVTAGYHEDRYFRPGDTGYPVVALGDEAAARVGFPTCWDQWFPELARAYALAGADVIVYPTAIGSEPDHPGFDTQPLWHQVIVGNGIANGTFMVAVNRLGTETSGGATLTFYGSSFISDPYGRVLVEAPRDEPAVIVADLDLDARRDWLELFPFLATRRPDTYGGLVSG